MEVTSNGDHQPSKRAGKRPKPGSSMSTSPRRSSRISTNAQGREHDAPLAIAPSKCAGERPQPVSSFPNPPRRSPRHLIRKNYAPVAIAPSRRAGKRPKQRRRSNTLPLSLFPTSPSCSPRHFGTAREREPHVPLAIAPYKYTPLNKKALEIRLMTLHPGVFRSGVRVSIRNDVLSECQTPAYEALSYAWGSNQKTVNIRVEGTEGCRTLAVTSNLAEALQYLRYKNRSRILWIDAICVDQQNVQERGHQVSRMAGIFRGASPVVIWLGPNSASSTVAMK